MNTRSSRPTCASGWGNRLVEWACYSVRLTEQDSASSRGFLSGRGRRAGERLLFKQPPRRLVARNPLFAAQPYILLLSRLRYTLSCHARASEARRRRDQLSRRLHTASHALTRRDALLPGSAAPRRLPACELCLPRRLVLVRTPRPGLALSKQEETRRLGPAGPGRQEELGWSERE